MTPLRVAIAGGSQGIGAACARALAAEGAELLLCSRTPSEVEALALELHAHSITADLASDAGAQRFAERAFDLLGDVDLGLICIGEGQRLAPLQEATRALLLEQLEQNALAPALVGAALLRGWAARPKQRDRQLLFLSSLVTRGPPLPGAAPYTAGKSALEAFVRAFAEEAWPGVRANALCLGPTATRMHRRAGTPAELIAGFPLPDQVAPLVLLLAGPRASGITGRSIDADALLADSEAALLGSSHLAEVRPLQPAGADDDPPAPEAEPGRRPSPSVRRAVRATVGELQRYPDTGAKLAARLAGLHGAAQGSVALSGGGASELLERSLRALCAPGDEVLSYFPTFELLSAFCSRLGLRHRPVPAPRLDDGLFGAHLAAPLLAAVGPRTRVVYVASPDNPTGAVLAPEAELELRRLLPASTTLIVDEAWSGPASALPGPSGKQAGFLRLRSFSKLHGLAALRIGYAVGSPAAAALLLRLQLPYPLGAPQLAAAGAVLDEPERTRRAGLLLARERARLAEGLRQLGLSVSAGDAPVLLVRSPAGGAGRLLFALQLAGAMVQEAHWDPPCLVLALSTRAQNAKYLGACRRALE